MLTKFRSLLAETKPRPGVLRRAGGVSLPVTLPASSRLPLARLLFLVALAAFLALAGCQQSTPSSANTTVAVQPAVNSDEPKTESPSAPADGRLIEETWDAYSMNGIRVGYAHTLVSRVQDEGRDLVRTWSHVHTDMQRSGQSITQDMTLTSWDAPDGGLLRFESRVSGGPGEIVSVGAVRNGMLGIDTTTLGRTQSQKIPWHADWGGLFAPEQSLRRSPLKPGEKRTLHCLMPIMNIPAETRLEALDYENVDLPAGTPTRRVSEGSSTLARSVSEGSVRPVKLLKVNVIAILGQQKIESIAWINDKGDTLKSLLPSIGQEAVRTTKADALQQKTGEKYDLLLASTVPLRGASPPSHKTKRAVYRAHLKSGQIAGLFSDCPSQRVKPIDDQSAELTVLAIRPEQELGDVPKTPPPVEADSAPNNFIQSDDAVIKQMAAHVAASETDPWQLACALEKFVQGAVHDKNFSTAFATAAEVARSQEGDCTEHAVLLAALCRARKIPARCAFGLVYYPPEKGFAYHMWNEVWINDRWIPLDPTLGLGGIGADHIKLGDSNLSGGSPLADLLNVIQVFGRLELEVLEVE
jgi:hypothetical protein